MMAMQEFDAHNMWFLEETDETPSEVSEQALPWHERIDLMQPSPLQITVSWRGHILSLSTLTQPRPLTIGSAASNDVVLEHEALDAESLSLLSAEDGEWRLHVHAFMDTTFHHNDQQLRVQDVFAKRLEHETSITLSLATLAEEQGHFHIRAAELDILIERVNHAPRAPLHAPIDPTPLPYLGLSTGLHIALMLMILTLPAGIDQLQEEFEAPESPRFVRAIVISPQLPPVPENPPEDALEDYDLRGDGSDAMLGAQHKGEEGKAGRDMPNNAATQKLSVKNRDTTAHRERVAATQRTTPSPVTPSETGALAVLPGHSDLFGAAQVTQGDALEDHIGNLRNRRQGDASGSFGIGIVGTGQGGGARQESVGIAMDQAMQRIKLGGQGVAQRKEKRGEKLDDLFLKYHKVDTATRGCLSEDMIKRAIRRRRNQIRTCYEHHLLKDRSLAGRVAVELTIGQSGEVSYIEVLEDTLGHDGVSECVTRKLSDLSFPAFSECETVVARYPFNFHPKQLMVLP